MKRNSILKIAVLLLVLNFSCKNDPLDDCFKSTGKIHTEDRTVTANFNVITVYDNVTLYYTQDSIYSISVEAGNNLLSEITTEVQDTILLLHNNNKCNWVRKFGIPVNVYVHAPNVIKLIGRNTGQIISTNTITANVFDFEGWESNHFDLTVNCHELDCSLNLDACDAIVKGHADNCFLWTAGNGFFHNDSLTTNFTSLTAKGTGDTYINVQNILIATILDEGNVYYMGNPTITLNKTGTGQLIKQ
jgi:hypothetical protein